MHMLKSDRKYHYKIERRSSVPFWHEILAAILAIAITLLICGALILQSGASLSDAYSALFVGAFGSKKAILETLVQATPILFTGLAMVIAYRANYINLGAEGQFLFGAIAATWVGLSFPSLPKPISISLQITAAIFAGAIWGLIPALMRIKVGASEIIVTVMLNFVVQYFLSYLVSNPWRPENEFYNQTAKIATSATWPNLFDSRLHIGFIIGIFLSLTVLYLIWNTKIGFELRSVGENPTASKYKGISINKIAILSMMLSGAIAAIGGAGEISGIHHRLKPTISKGYGWTGITIALLGRTHPIGIIISSIFFGGLINGSSFMKIKTGVESSLADAFQGAAMIVVLILLAVVQYRVRRIEVNG